MSGYSEEFKRSMVKRLAAPGGPGPCALAREVGIPQQTLSRWRQEYGILPGMKKKSKHSAVEDWGAEEKLKAVIEAGSLKEPELGEYLRQRGLHSADIERWKAEALEVLEPRGRGRPKKDPEVYEQRKRVKELEKELRRKERALAEASALLVMKKKAELIWGASKDDESE